MNRTRVSANPLRLSYVKACLAGLLLEPLYECSELHREGTSGPVRHFMVTLQPTVGEEVTFWVAAIAEQSPVQQA
jgi:hypothetical protein